MTDTAPDSAHRPDPSPPAPPAGRIVLVRHGQTEWSRTGRHTGRTDIPLTTHGEAEARALAASLAGFRIVRVLSSPLQRARRTAELAGLAESATIELDPDLMEWDYGGYEGRTTAEIRRETGTDWSVWRDGVPSGDTPGESLEQVGARAGRVLDSVRADLTRGDVTLVAHAHLLRALAGVWAVRDPQLGAHLHLDSGTLSVLAFEHDTPALTGWNLHGGKPRP